MFYQLLISAFLPLNVWSSVIQQPKPKQPPEASQIAQTPIVITIHKPIEPLPYAWASSGCQQYVPLISKYDWDVRTAVAVCMAESGGNPKATGYNTNATTDRGVFQVNSCHSDMVSSLDSLYDPETNIAVAYRIYKGSGWRAWSTFNNGSVYKYL